MKIANDVISWIINSGPRKLGGFRGVLLFVSLLQPDRQNCSKIAKPPDTFPAAWQSPLSILHRR